MKHFITGAGSGIGAAVRSGALCARRRADAPGAHQGSVPQELADAFPGASLLVGDLAQPWRSRACSPSRCSRWPSTPCCTSPGSPSWTGSAACRRPTPGTSSTSTCSARCVLTSALLPALRKRRGHVVFANSSAGIHAKPGWAAYCAVEVRPARLRRQPAGRREGERDPGDLPLPRPDRHAHAAAGACPGRLGLRPVAVDPAGDGGRRRCCTCWTCRRTPTSRVCGSGPRPLTPTRRRAHPAVGRGRQRPARRRNGGAIRLLPDGTAVARP